jgi:phage terminase small subunit
MRSAKVLANQLLDNPLLREKVARLKEQRNQCTKLDADWVLQRLRDEVEADLIDIISDDGRIRPMRELPMIWRTGLVAGFEVTEVYGRDQDGHRIVVGVTKRIRFSDRLKRLELIGKHTDIGAFRERAVASDDEPLRRLYNQIAGKAIRPREERDEEEVLEVPPRLAVTDGIKH